jgi:serine phosphatase RsbU (regulator of sigma subunit)/Tfp pilus assembly protein PilF
MKKNTFHYSFSFFTYVLLTCMFVLHVPAYSQTRNIDSLLKLLPTLKEDTVKVNVLNDITRSYMTELNNSEKVAEYSAKGFALSQKLNFKRGIAVGTFYKGFGFWSKGKYPEALVHYKKALEIMTEIKNLRGQSFCYLNIGQTYQDMGNTPYALSYMLKGLKIKEELNDQVGLEIGYNNIGNIFFYQGNYTQAVGYYLKALKIAEERNDRLIASYANTNIGTIFYTQNKLDIALVYFKKAVTLQEILKDMQGAGSNYSNIGNIYATKKQFKEALVYHLKDLHAKESVDDKQGQIFASTGIGSDYYGLKEFDQALIYFLKSLTLSKHTGFRRGLINASGGIGQVYEEKKEYQKALVHYDQMLTVAKELDAKDGIRDAFAFHASVYTKLKQFEKALEYTELFHNAKDTLLNKDNFKQVAELNTRYETDKKEKEILLLTKDQELNAKTIKQQQLLRWGLIGGLFLLFIAIISIYRRYRFKQQANVILEQQKEEIQQKNILITDSIDYAKTIQEAVLPTNQEIKKLLPDSFVLYKPKAIVSGDFYWLHTVGNKLICAVADCTGHGVPGAFMSLLGYNMLEDVVKTATVNSPGLLLDELNQQVIIRLSGDDKEETIKHGMDISLIVVDKANNRLEFAGAHNPLYIARADELIELKADKIGIGANKKQDRSFTSHTFELQKGDVIYLFTDGFPDQIGGPNRKKFYYPPFKELLLANSALEMDQQKTTLEETHNNWRSGKYEQTDDILIMGIRY